MARLGRTAVVVFLALATVACGSQSVARRGETSYGRGADEVWVFRAADGPPRSVVVFVHGHGGPLRQNVGVEVVHSHGAFIASHLSVLDDSAGARSAFWDRADALIDIAAPR